MGTMPGDLQEEEASAMTTHVVPGPDGLNRRAFSAGDVRRMTEAGILGEDDPFELVDGELIETAAKGFAHDRIRDELARILIVGTDAPIGVSVEATLQLDPRTLIEPDLLVHRRTDALPSIEGYKVVEGARVLLAVEISASSLAYDRRRKAVLYAAHGVSDYWVVDVNDLRTFVHRDPRGGTYHDVADVPADAELRPAAPDLAHIRIRLGDLA